MSRIRVLIADDHALVREGLRALLDAQPDLEVVGEAQDGVSAVTQSLHLKPDVVVMDLAMPGRSGIKAIEDLRQASPATRVVVLTMHDDEAYVRLARLAGAQGFVLKRSLATELIRAIRAVHAGQTHFPEVELPAPRQRGGSPAELLTEREREVLRLIAHGHTTAAIAARLHISEKTVETHRAHIAEKLGLRTRADLVHFAIEHGLLKA
ncbi:MAG: response regulator transcription factor [Verrucomicrobiales bacterium]|nr:response regulator transcription factor [Verrucomicrobiales bacterium]